MKKSRADILRDLQTIPSVGKSIAVDLWDLGIRRVEDLKGESPDHLYNRLCMLRRQPIDRCMLYTFRCAVYFASHKKHDPEKLQWWYWKGV